MTCTRSASQHTVGKCHDAELELSPSTGGSVGSGTLGFAAAGAGVLAVAAQRVAAVLEPDIEAGRNTIVRTVWNERRGKAVCLSRRADT